MVPRRLPVIYALTLVALGRHEYSRTISEAGKGEGGRGLGPFNNKE